GRGSSSTACATCRRSSRGSLWITCWWPPSTSRGRRTAARLPHNSSSAPPSGYGTSPACAAWRCPRRSRSAAAPVLVVNQAFAEHEWPGASAIGRCVDIGWKDNVKCYRVVGVVANAKYVNLEEPPRPAFFQAAAQDPGADVL